MIHLVTTTILSVSGENRTRTFSSFSLGLLSNIYNAHNVNVPQGTSIKIVLIKEEELTIKKQLLTGSPPFIAKNNKIKQMKWSALEKSCSQVLAHSLP